MAKTKTQHEPVDAAEDHSLVRRSTARLRTDLEAKRDSIVEKHGQSVYDDALAGKLSPFKMAFLLSTGRLLRKRERPRKNSEKFREHRARAAARHAKKIE